MKRIIPLFLTLFLFHSAIAQDQTDILQTLKTEHPRLILQLDDLPRIKALIQTDQTAKIIYQNLKKQADRLLNEPTVEYKIVGPRLLTQSRRCLERVYTLSLVFLLDRDEKYLKRVVNELYAASQFPGWNPSHYLDTAEMTHAFAIGYDWLFDSLSQDEKNWIKKAIIEKGLNTALTLYKEGGWWTKSTHNWNQVCNGGIGIGALAIGDEEPELAKMILDYAFKSLPLALNSYAPDGGWNEGPGYWHYATRYTVYFLAALDTALGTDFGFSEYEGLDNAGTFRIHFVSPLDLTFNYADSSNRAGSAHEMFWLAKRYNKPAYAWHQRERLSRPSALDLVWYTPEGNNPAKENIPLDAYYRGIEVAFLRSAWNDPNAIFVGFKGGDNKANHSHLDLGNFVLDAEGVRWVVDLGSDNYNLPRYFDTKKTRWTYYRLRTESHNTLTLNHLNQDRLAEAPIIKFHSTPERTHAVTDLTAAYKGVNHVKRGIALIDRRYVLIQDEIDAIEPIEIEWSLMTAAAISIDGKTALLKQKGKVLQARIHVPDDAVWGTKSAKPKTAEEKQNDGMTKLTVTFPVEKVSVRLVITLTPAASIDKIPKILIQPKPLSQWE